MGSRTASLLALLLLASPAAAVALAPPPPPQVNLALGYGPQSMEPVTFGVPVFTAGDQLWVESFYNTTTYLITLNEPASTGGGVAQAQYFLSPGVLLNLYTFGVGDPLGNWSLNLYSTVHGTSTTLRIAVVGSASLVPAFDGAEVIGSSLSLAYTLPATSAYDVQECTMGASPSSAATFQLPGNVGGTLGVSLRGTAATVSASGAANGFTGWLELYTSRAFQNGGTVVSDETMAAKSQGIFHLNSTSITDQVVLNPDLALRPGRYDLRAYARGPSGLTSYDAPFLLLNGTDWVSLGSCTQRASISSSSFHLTTSMDGPSSTWPRKLYTMYTSEGVDGVTVSTVPVSEAKIDIKNNATSGLLTGVDITASGVGVQSWSGYNSAVYVIGTSYPLTVNVTLGFEKVSQESFDVRIPGPFQQVPLRVEAGTLAVSLAANGRPLANATVRVTSAGSQRPVLFSSDVHGNLTLTLPPGDYEVNASLGGVSGERNTRIVAGQTDHIRIDLGSGGVPAMDYVLAAVMVAGVGANLLVWRAYRERRRE